MRDYAELIKLLRYYGAFEQHSKEAADAIEELLAAVPYWISVEERLPDDFSRVLGFMAWGGMMLLERQNKGWYLADRIQQVPDEAVLYWMPLPKPPKEDTE